MADYVNLFNDKLLEFFGELITFFPEKPEFNTYYNLTNGALFFNNELPSSIFNDKIMKPYGNHIENKNEEFLLDNDYSPDLKSENIHDSSFIDGLKTVWKNLDQTNKDTIWTYIKLLVALNKRIQNEKK